MSITRYARRIYVVGFGLLMLLFVASIRLEAGWLEPFVQARKRAAQQEVSTMIHDAKSLAHQGNYINALRLLFDAMYKEQRTRQFLVKYSKEALESELDELFPIMAAREIMEVEYQLIRDDSSPLMQWFRQPDTPLQEKLTMLTDLQNLATRRSQEGEDVLFRGKYQGTFVQLLTSPQLHLREKNDVLGTLRTLIHTEYTSESQQDSIVEDIRRLRQEAAQKFQAQHYVDAFILIDEANRKADKMPLDLVSRQEDILLGEQRVEMYETFVSKDESPLMQVFKNRNIPTGKRQLLLDDLRKMIAPFKSVPNTIMLDGITYDGTFVDILTHSQVDWLTKNMLFVTIEGEILRQEPDYLPDYKWKHDEEFMKLWEEHEQGKKNHKRYE